MDDATAIVLEKETRKWLSRLEKISGFALNEKADTAAISWAKNISAYISDCRHFLEKKDFVRAFEAIIYAWGIYETLLHLGMVDD